MMSPAHPVRPRLAAKIAALKDTRILGHDVFISYSRADSATYAARLASELTKRSFSCRLDQWGSRPGKEVPSELLRALRRSSMLVLVGSAGAAASSAVEREIREFLPTGRLIVPIDTDGSIRSATWWPLLDGLAVAQETSPDGHHDQQIVPSQETIDRIINCADFTRRNTKLTRYAIGALVVLGLLVGLAIVAGQRATTADFLWRQAEGQRATAQQQAQDAAADASQQRMLATEADVSRQQAEDRRAAAESLGRKAAADAKQQQEFAAEARRERLAAEEARAEAQKNLAETRAKLETTNVELSQQTAVAESRELARLAGEVGPTENQERLQKAIRATETSATEAAQQALSGAIRAVISTVGPQPYVVDDGGKFAAVAGRHGQGLLVDLDSERETELCGSPEPIELLSFSPDGGKLLTTRYHHNTPNNERVWEYQLWNTGKGMPLGSVLLPLEAEWVKWSPDSSLFLAYHFGSSAYRVKVQPDGSMIGSVQPAPYSMFDSSGVVFTLDYMDYPLYLLYDTTIELSGASLWNYSGVKLWESEPVQVEWAAFRNDGSRVIVSLNGPGRGVQRLEVLELDHEGKPRAESTIVTSDQFDYGMLSGAPLDLDLRSTLGESIRRKNPKLVKDCKYLPYSSAGVVFCAQDGRAPLLFDLATQKALGALEPWTFGDVMEKSVFSPDGSLVLVASAREWLTAWDTARRELRWQIAANAHSYGFSKDGKRVVSADHSQSGVLVLEAATGKQVSSIPTIGAYGQQGYGWLNETATRLATVEPEPTGQTLTLWDVDRAKVLRHIELSSADQAEEKRDLAILGASPTPEALLEIARRRLRACEGAQSRVAGRGPMAAFPAQRAGRP